MGLFGSLQNIGLNKMNTIRVLVFLGSNIFDRGHESIFAVKRAF